MDLNIPRYPGRPSCCSRCMVIGSRSFALGNALAVLAVLIFSIYFLVTAFAPPSQAPNSVDPGRKHEPDWFIVVIAIVFFVFAVIAFIFALILYCGVHKRKSVLIKSYVVFGVIVIVLSMIGAGALTIIYWNHDWGIVIRIPPFATGICVVYALILWMIHRTRPRTRDEVKLVEHNGRA